MIMQRGHPLTFLCKLPPLSTCAASFKLISHILLGILLSNMPHLTSRFALERRQQRATAKKSAANKTSNRFTCWPKSVRVARSFALSVCVCQCVCSLGECICVCVCVLTLFFAFSQMKNHVADVSSMWSERVAHFSSLFQSHSPLLACSLCVYMWNCHKNEINIFLTKKKSKKTTTTRETRATATTKQRQL